MIKSYGKQMLSITFEKDSRRASYTTEDVIKNLQRAVNNIKVTLTYKEHWRS